MADETPAPAKPEGAAAAAKPAPAAAAAAAKPAAGAKAPDPKAKKPAGKRGPLPLILGIVGGLVVLTAVSLGIIYTVVLPKLKVAEAHAKTRAQQVAEATVGPVFQIKDMVINSADRDEIHYVKLSLAFEVRDAKAVEELGLREAQLRDLLITEFGRYTVRELNSPEGREQIRNLLRQKLSQEVRGVPVKNLYFTEFVGQ